MTLQVPFEGFADAVRRNLGVGEAYISQVGQRVLATAASAVKLATIVAAYDGSLEEARAKLHAQGLQIYDGLWSVDDDHDILVQPYIAAVAYNTGGPQPGIWIEASRMQPTDSEVLLKLFSEFQATGELGQMTIEEFRERAQPTILILNPDQINALATSTGLD